ncbi:MAG: cobalamin-independent methionine synthase II family protein [Chloroflexi bacterium]|nr:cobalamin-independent methionine synthase II family protein [Chloroflexota bacterium]MBV9898941.1 cobalamin-independent methionine synthase II family protein [Chloroflexota bacterium]
MLRSTDRILVSHAGTLPRPDAVARVFNDGTDAELERALPDAVREVVQRQAQLGIDIVNDGEFSKRGGFSGYVRNRISGIQQRSVPAGEGPRAHDVTARDRREFPGAFAAGVGPFRGGGTANQPFFCTGPLAYIGKANVESDIARLKAACEGLEVEPYLPAIAPGTVEHWLWNEHYPDTESFLFAIADALHEEYKAITDAGVLLQIDDPDLPDGWQMEPSWTVSQYREYADLRVAAINRALDGIPEDRVRLHICWGSGHGPHKNDIPLRDIVDIALKVRAQCYSVEAANPRHAYEWHVWETTKLAPGKSLMPGAVGHATNVVEHPETVADLLVRYANVVGRENVIAGTDCGIGTRVGHPEIAWAKLESLVEGARIATKHLWGR